MKLKFAHISHNIIYTVTVIYIKRFRINQLKRNISNAVKASSRIMGEIIINTF